MGGGKERELDWESQVLGLALLLRVEQLGAIIYMEQ